MKEVSIGIDLGTTYSSVGFFKSNENQCEMIDIPAQSTKSVSSTVIFYYSVNSNKYSVDIKYPQSRDFSRPYFIESKRFIGLTYEQFQQQNLQRDYFPFTISKDNETGYIKMEYDEIIRTQNKTEVRKHSYYPEEISALIVDYLLKIAVQRLPERKISSAVVSVPVCFSTKQREATIRACKLAGLEHIKLINEPTAALVAYHHKNKDITVGKKVLVVDIGGGTMDVCCAKLLIHLIIPIFPKVKQRIQMRKLKSWQQVEMNILEEMILMKCVSNY